MGMSSRYIQSFQMSFFQISSGKYVTNRSHGDIFSHHVCSVRLLAPKSFPYPTQNRFTKG
jgi:hypothetical protein